MGPEAEGVSSQVSHENLFQTLGREFLGVEINPLEDDMRVFVPKFDEYFTLMKVLEAAGYNWKGSDRPTMTWESEVYNRKNDTHWYHYGDETCIHVSHPLFYATKHAFDDGKISLISPERFYEIKEISPERVSEIVSLYDNIENFFGGYTGPD